MGSRRFFQARAGRSDANAKPIIIGLRERGHLVIVVRSAEAYFEEDGQEGISDLLVYPWALERFPPGRPPSPREPRLCRWLEIKMPKGKLRDTQLAWKALATAVGIPVFTARNLVEAIAATEGA